MGTFFGLGGPLGQGLGLGPGLDNKFDVDINWNYDDECCLSNSKTAVICCSLSKKTQLVMLVLKHKSLKYKYKIHLNGSHNITDCPGWAGRI